MPEHNIPAEVDLPPSGTAAHLDPEGLRAAIAEVVLATAGVVRLEPTLRSAGLHGLGRLQPFDGIHLIVRSSLVDADVNVSTIGTHQARVVAEDLHRRLTDFLNASRTGRVLGHLTINVLSIDQATQRMDA